MEDLETSTKRNLAATVVLLNAITEGFGPCAVRQDKEANVIHITLPSSARNKAVQK